MPFFLLLIGIELIYGGGCWLGASNSWWALLLLSVGGVLCGVALAMAENE